MPAFWFGFFYCVGFFSFWCFVIVCLGFGGSVVG